MNAQVLEYIFEQAKKENFKDNKTIENLIRELITTKTYNESTEIKEEQYLRG